MFDNNALSINCHHVCPLLYIMDSFIKYMMKMYACIHIIYICFHMDQINIHIGYITIT